ncbi:MAG: hypothetical protein ABIJ00_11850, partial [Candidatus Eisenbacteria bacterium]
DSIQEQIEKAIAKDPELQTYVRRMEEQESEDAAKGEEMLSPEIIVRELEDFLRRKREEQGDGEGS